MDAEVKKKLPNYIVLVSRIQQLIIIVNKLSNKVNEHQSEIFRLQQQLEKRSEVNRAQELEDDVKKLKKENKRLKEKERIIKTKIERLSVKLDQIHV